MNVSVAACGLMIQSTELDSWISVFHIKAETVGKRKVKDVKEEKV